MLLLLKPRIWAVSHLSDPLWFVRGLCRDGELVISVLLFSAKDLFPLMGA